MGAFVALSDLGRRLNLAHSGRVSGASRALLDFEAFALLIDRHADLNAPLRGEIFAGDFRHLDYTLRHTPGGQARGGEELRRALCLDPRLQPEILNRNAAIPGGGSKGRFFGPQERRVCAAKRPWGAALCQSGASTNVPTAAGSLARSVCGTPCSACRDSSPRRGSGFGGAAPTLGGRRPIPRNHAQHGARHSPTRTGSSREPRAR